MNACAWCLAEQGREMGNGSHGICTRHAAEVRQQQQARKSARAKQDGKQGKVAA